MYENIFKNNEKLIWINALLLKESSMGVNLFDQYYLYHLFAIRKYTNIGRYNVCTYAV